MAGWERKEASSKSSFNSSIAVISSSIASHIFSSLRAFVKPSTHPVPRTPQQILKILDNMPKLTGKDVGEVGYGMMGGSRAPFHLHMH
jgi:hypothetical protein